MVIILTILAPPSIVTTHHTVETRAGHNISLACRARGRPAPSVQWRRDGVDGGEHCEAVHGDAGDECEAVLVLMNTVIGDAGLYTCYAGNIWGTATANTTLVVTGIMLPSPVTVSKFS